jgi:hypothetical protein
MILLRTAASLQFAVHPWSKGYDQRLTALELSKSACAPSPAFVIVDEVFDNSAGATFICRISSSQLARDCCVVFVGCTSDPSHRCFPKVIPAPTLEIHDKSDISIYVSSQTGQGGLVGRMRVTSHVPNPTQGRR